MSQTADAYIGLRLPKWLKAQVQDDAKRSGWKLSNQIVFELLERRGKWVQNKPYLPSPTHDGHRRKKTAA